MKFFVFLLMPALALLNARAQQVIPSEPQIVAKGSAFRVWEQLSTTVLIDGRTVTNRSSYTELASGLHHLVNGEYVVSDDGFELFQNQAVARHAAHQAILNANINTDDAVDLLSPSGQRLVLRPRWLCFYDPLTQANSIIAEIKDSAGALVEKNVVIWEDCWTDFRGSIRATFTTTSFESDLLIHDEGFGLPEDYGLQSGRVRLELWHEVFEAPAAQVGQRVLEDGSLDQTVSFGDLAIGEGKAFSVDRNDESVDVSKTWTIINGRRFLIESVSYARLRPLLDKLNQQARVGPARDRVKQMAKVVPSRQAVVAKMSRPPAPAKPQVLMASVKRPGFALGPAVVVDYTILSVGGDPTDYVFKGDETYYITGKINFQGTNTTFEGGCVIKMAPTNSPRISLTNAVTWQGTAYRPVVITARDDHSIGQAIGSAGLSGYYGDTALYFDSTAAGTNLTLQNVRICYATNAITIKGGSGHSITHAQFVNCMTGIRGTNTQFTLRNALLHKVYTNFNGSAATGRCEHLTIDVATWLNFNSNIGVTLTNSLLGAVTNLGTIMESNYVAKFTDPTGVWQTVGSANHYLSTNSSYRGAGTTNINQPLLTSLRRLTTYPPIVLTSHFSGSTTLTPQAQRGSGSSSSIDIGFHYDPLDYCWTSLYLSNNAVLTLASGTAVAYYGATGTTVQSSNSTFNCEGTPTNLNRLVTYQTVQEQPTTWGSGTPQRMFEIDTSPTTASTLPVFRLRFTDVSVMAPTASRYLLDMVNDDEQVKLFSCRDSQIRGAALYARPSFDSVNQMTLAFTNNLLQRVNFDLTQGNHSDTTPFATYLRNNLVYGGTVSVRAGSDAFGLQWVVQDNFLDTATLTGSGSKLTNSYNGYRSTTVLPSPTTNNVMVTNVAYQIGPLAGFYYPTSGGIGTLASLIDVGSQRATNAGLYHFTTSTNQTKEGTSMVDIGWHLVGLNASWTTAADTDGDGIPDYAEDVNGNGSVDSGETDWNNANDWGFRVFITRPKRGSNLP